SGTSRSYGTSAKDPQKALTSAHDTLEVTPTGRKQVPSSTATIVGPLGGRSPILGCSTSRDGICTLRTWMRWWVRRSTTLLPGSSSSVPAVKYGNQRGPLRC